MRLHITNVLLLVFCILVIFVFWFDDHKQSFETHQELHEFVAAGERFTRDDGELLCEELKKLAKDNGEEVNCEFLDR